MKKVNFFKKEKIITTCGIIILVIISIIGFNYYQKQEKQKKIDTYIREIQKTEKEFSVDEKREDKINVLKSLLKEREKYEQSDNNIDEVRIEYNEIISSMQKYFKDEYNKALQDSKLEEVDKISDKKILNSNKINLITLLKTIQSEKEIILTTDEYKKYEDNINGLIKTYDARLAVIEEKDKKEEEELKSKEEVKKKDNKQSSTQQNYNVNNSSKNIEINNRTNGESSQNKNESYSSNQKNQNSNSEKSNKVNRSSSSNKGNSSNGGSSNSNKHSNENHTHFSDGKGYESWGDNGKYHDTNGNTWTQKDIDDDNF